jgi:[ribosomal protein S5]-alanine N-acetyltransferase
MKHSVYEPLTLRTERLRLVFLDPALTRIAVERRADVEALIGGVIPSTWRATGFKDFLPVYLRQLERQGDTQGWGIWLIMAPADDSLDGDAGFNGPPDERGQVETAFTVMPHFRNRGYASEAVRALVDWALGQPGVTAVIASCDPGNIASQRVLSRAGLSTSGQTIEAERWRRERTETEEADQGAHVEGADRPRSQRE